MWLSGVISMVALGIVLPSVAQATEERCGNGQNGSAGYAYAGHQAAAQAHGVRATITPIAPAQVLAGHVAGWIGVGGPGQGPNGETEWIQIGIASLPNTPTMIYAEITAPGRDPAFIPLVQDVKVGESHRLAVLEMRGQPDWWRVWLNGQAVSEPVHLPGSHKLWRPIVTAESFNNHQPVCNTFAFRFERVGVAQGLGGSWRPFQPGYDFLDRGYTLRPLKPVRGNARTLSSSAIDPYAFEAFSA